MCYRKHNKQQKSKKLYILYSYSYNTTYSTVQPALKTVHLFVQEKNKNVLRCVEIKQAGAWNMSHLSEYVGSVGVGSDDETCVDVVQGRTFQLHATVIVCIHAPFTQLITHHHHSSIVLKASPSHPASKKIHFTSTPQRYKVLRSASLYACLLACLKNHTSNFTTFSVRITCGRGLNLLRRQCNKLCTSGLRNFM